MKSLLFSACGVFLLFLSATPGRFYASDVTPRLMLTRQIWTHSELTLPAAERPEGLIETATPGRWTSLYGMGQTLLFIPFDVAGVAFARLLNAQGEIREQIERLPIYFLYVPLLGLLWWLSLCLSLEKTGVTAQHSRQTTLLFFLVTILWFYASQSPQEEALVGALLMAAFIQAQNWIHCPARRTLLFIGVFVGAALMVRLNSAVGILPLLGLLIDAIANKRVRTLQSLRAIGWVIVGTLPFVALHLVCAQGRFGDWTSTGYDLGYRQGMGVTWSALDWPRFWRLAFGPGKGLFLLSPALLIALWGWRPWFKKAPGVAVATAIAMLVSLVLSAKIFNNPDGSESWGARYQVHLLSFWIFPFYEGLLALHTRWQKAAAGALLAISLCIQFASSLAPTGVEYLQVRHDSISRETIGGDLAQGQLGLRLKNVALWSTGRSISMLAPPENSTALRYLETQYIPSFWGPVYAKRLNQPWVVFGWGLCAALSLVLLVASRRTPESKP